MAEQPWAVNHVMAVVHIVVGGYLIIVQTGWCFIAKLYLTTWGALFGHCCVISQLRSS